MSGQTEESQRFKKTHQVVGGGENNATVGNFNDEIMKSFGGSEENRNNPPRSADDGREREIAEKGYSNKPTDEQLDQMDDIKQKLDKRGN